MSQIQCCKSGVRCDSELETGHVCHDGNQTYYEGQTFTPAGDRGVAVGIPLNANRPLLLQGNGWVLVIALTLFA